MDGAQIKRVKVRELLNELERTDGDGLMAGRVAGEGVWRRRGSREDKEEERSGAIVWLKDQTWRSSQRASLEGRA